ncbi:hypothetical protein ACLOJK_016118 [Asimina triloba]
MESQAPHNLIRVLERCAVAPPPRSFPTTALPLTFFDVLWLQIPPVQRLFFYQLPDTDTDTTALLSKLKHSLSLALQIFYPLAGILTHNSATDRHEILYSEGDSVRLTIAHSDSDFNRLVGHEPCDATEFHPLAPNIPEYATLPSPALALQVTLFPNSGLCVGLAVHHAAADGWSSTHFMKAWASIYRTGDISTVHPLPVYDRAQTVALDWIAESYFRHLAELPRVEVTNRFFAGDATASSRLVRATYVLTRGDIERLRGWVAARVVGDSRFSSFVVTCSYVWACLTKASARSGAVDGGKTVYFAMAVDLRARLRPPLAPAYFGNCIGACFTQAAESELIGEDGLVVAAESIRGAIGGLEGDGALRGADTWVKTFFGLVGERVLSIAGSPLLRVYDTQFGWGKPRKVEVLSIEDTGAISLAESRDEDGGIEIGLAVPDSEMDGFECFFREGLERLR